MMLQKIDLKKLHRSLGDEDGSQLVEFAISVLVLLSVVFGIMDFCRAIYAYHFVSYAAQEGARFAMVRGNGWAGYGACNTSAPPSFTAKYDCVAKNTDVQNYVRSIAMPGINANNVAVNTNWPGTSSDCATANNSPSCPVSVNVTYTFTFMMPFLPRSASLRFSGTSEKAIQE